MKKHSKFLFVSFISLSAINAQSADLSFLEEDIYPALWEQSREDIIERIREAKSAIRKAQPASPESWAAYCEVSPTQESCKGYFYSIRDQIINKKGSSGCLPSEFGNLRAVYYSWLARNSAKYKSMSHSKLEEEIRRPENSNLHYIFELDSISKYRWIKASSILSKVRFQDSTKSAFLEARRCD